MSLGGGDLQVILRRIRHGFIICDDTELCDKIISQEVEAEQRRRTLAKSKSIDVEKTDLLTLLRSDPDFVLDELSHSPEWTITNVQVRRVRCETLGRLDEIKTENERKGKLQVIPWVDPPPADTETKNVNESLQFNSDEADSLSSSSSSLFQRRTEPVAPLVQPSPLTALLRSAAGKQNPFAQYAKFDGTPNIITNQSKKFILHFKSQKQKLPIIVSSQATVAETIGFACYKYTTDNREPPLTQKDPSKYSLCIADDDGQAEEDFPPLTHNQPIRQYGFPQLALIEQVSSLASSNRDDYPTDEYGSEDGDDDDEPLDDSSESVTPPNEEARTSISSSGRISTVSVPQEAQSNVDPINNLSRLYESLNQKSYQFDYYLKPSSSKHVKVRIDVSGEQIRFELLEKTSRLSWQNMPLSTQRVVDCRLSDKELNKKKDRIHVYLVIESQPESNGTRMYQTYELESTVEIVEQFREQVLKIIQLKNPQGRDSYEENEQQRNPPKKRRSIFTVFSGSSGSSSTKS